MVVFGSGICWKLDGSDISVMILKIHYQEYLIKDKIAQVSMRGSTQCVVRVVKYNLRVLSKIGFTLEGKVRGSKKMYRKIRKDKS